MQPLEVRSVFEAAQDPTFLHGLSLVNGFSEDVRSTDSNAITQEKLVAASGEERARGVPEISDRMCCSACSRVFDSREEQTEHYRLDWHRFNLKQRLLGRRALAAEEFEEKTHAGDVSSISGSDSDNSDSGSETDLLPPRGHADPGSGQQSHRSAKILFRNSQGQLLSAYRCVLGSKKGGGEQQAELVTSLQGLGAGTCWVILMTGGGHFAGAVFRGDMWHSQSLHGPLAAAAPGIPFFCLSVPRSWQCALAGRGVFISLLYGGPNRGRSSPGSQSESVLELGRKPRSPDTHPVCAAQTHGQACPHGVGLRPCSPMATRVWILLPWPTLRFLSPRPEVLDHKTFHRYTVRARRGTVQGARDAQGQASMPKSAGASLRRYNEAALLKDIQDLLASWAQHLQGAQRIFLRAPRANRALLFGGRNPPLHKDDPRVYNIPFSTRRATFREVLRVHVALATLQVYGKDTAVADLAGSPRKGWRKVPCAPVEEPQQGDASTPSEEEESQAGELETVEVTLSTLQLQEFEVMPKRSRKRRKKKNKVGRGACAEGPGGHEEPEGSAPQPGAGMVAEPQDGPGAEPAPWENGETLLGQLRDALFTACKTGDTGTLRRLLGAAESGAPPAGSEDGAVGQPQGHPGRVQSEGSEPTCAAPGLLSLLGEPIDGTGFTLLHVAAAAGKGAAVRLLLEAGADPALRDWQERPPYCVSADKSTRNVFRRFMVDHPAKYDYRRAKVPGPLTAEMEAGRLEKQRAQKAQRKQRAQEQEEKRRFAALPDREKRALAAERRLAAQLPDTGAALANTRRCWQCGESLLGRIPFHYLDFSFCSTGCLQAHRRGRAGPT
ncbi:ankyrin repeat and zinc finger domain-containing protein 1 isoform X1 [Chelonia mydas]|uniref:ankyrin repeat and zinc finger domain-containing protein 1 isoform X1 n=1 Tax=Chelonia mydas TaxID=8469 RepID=UPI001CA9817B|nr:ankyrin repeat and zinc finger domain-containing protein 1 isoform X1 [Chelonia mydas]XP_043380877.1 ankyrin repeat and zinc finger domain-containing protein 1 isoform X1 [Chelonia mydas]